MRKSLAGVLLGLMLNLGVCAQEQSKTVPVLSLDEAVQIALANNRDLKIAGLEVEKSKWQVASAKTHRLPSFNAYLLASGNLTDSSFLFKEGSLGKIAGLPVPSKDTPIPLSHGVTGYALAQVAQPLTHLYKIHLNIREQELSSDLNSEQFRAKRQNVVNNVKQTYYAVLQTESTLTATATAVKQYEETDRVTKQYLAQEAVLKSDSLEVEAKLAQTRYQVVELQNNLQSQKEQLNDLLGRELETEFRTQPIPDASFAELDLKAAQQKALTQRPEIREAEISLQKADYDRKLAKAQYIPDVSAAFHYFSPLNTELLPTNVASAGVEMNYEVFEWGRRRDDLKQKTIAEDQSQYQLQQSRSQVLLDVNNRFRKLGESRQLLAVTQAARDAANQKLEEVSQKYSQEAVLLRDVLQQQTAVANANHEYDEALLSFWTAKANFEKALGEN
jgi:outer membrane protein TolC